MLAEYMREKLSEYYSIRQKAIKYQSGGSIISPDQLDGISNQTIKDNIISIDNNLDILGSIMEVQCNQEGVNSDYPILVQTLGNIKNKLEGLKDKFQQDKEGLQEELDN